MIEDICQILNDYKAEDVTVIDVRGKSSITDTIVICTGRSNTHINTLAKKLIEDGKSFDVKYTEGLDNSGWVVLDTGLSMIHIMSSEQREYYKIEDIWDIDF